MLVVNQLHGQGVVEAGELHIDEAVDLHEALVAADLLAQTPCGKRERGGERSARRPLLHRDMGSEVMDSRDVASSV
jgi:hypothetical protein